jgi:shikimate kinase
MDPTALGTRQRRHIVLAGAMGVGKTTVGRLLADELGLPFHDSDECLEARGYGSGTEIAAREGVARLHELELEVFLLLCDMPRPAVLAPAASVVDDEPGRRALADNFTVWLTAPGDVIAQRQAEGTHRRTISAEERDHLQATRAPLLAEASAVSLDTGSSSPNETVEKLIALLPESLRSSASD